MEQGENRPSISDTMIDFIEESESRPSTSSAESQFTHVYWFWNLVLIMYTYIMFKN